MFSLAVSTVVIYFLYWFVKPLLQSIVNLPPTEYAHSFVDSKTRIRKFFPSVFDSAEVNLSLIVPAYNEEARLEEMMEQTMAYLLNRKKQQKDFSFEVIIVDDGSKDRTVKVACKFVDRYSTDCVRVMILDENQGKGGAVQQGMLHARGEYLLMVDADGATRIQDLDKLDEQLKQTQKRGLGIAIGSRAHLQDKAVAKRKWYRNLLMYGFHFLVACLCVKKVRDTQCGFKLFTRTTAQRLFITQHLRRWCFDVELLYLAQAMDIPIVEVEVNWSEIPGSKVRILESSLLMGRDLVVIRLAYSCGIWRIADVPSHLRRKRT